MRRPWQADCRRGDVLDGDVRIAAEPLRRHAHDGVCQRRVDTARLVAHKEHVGEWEQAAYATAIRTLPGEFVSLEHTDPVAIADDELTNTMATAFADRPSGSIAAPDRAQMTQGFSDLRSACIATGYDWRLK